MSEQRGDELNSATLRVAAAQFRPGKDAAANRAAVTAFAEDALAQGARLVAFPEYSSAFDLPFSPELVALAEPLDGPYVSHLIAEADRLGIAIVSGMLEVSGEANKFRNTVVAVLPGQGVVATYRKQHLYDAFGAKESDWVVPGDLTAPEVFELDGVTVGLQTCYDLRFPEATRQLVDAGAELVLVPAQWVPGPAKEHHWRTLATARAIENTVYLLAADQAAPAGIGCSLVVSPAGETLADLGDEPGLAVATIERAELDRVRSVNPALQLRRYRVSPAE